MKHVLNAQINIILVPNVKILAKNALKVYAKLMENVLIK